jgi:hypothetical protein
MRCHIPCTCGSLILVPHSALLPPPSSLLPHPLCLYPLHIIVLLLPCLVVQGIYNTNPIVFELKPLLDCSNNPYLLCSLQDVLLNLHPNKFAILHIPSESPPHSTGMINSGHISSQSISTPMHDDMDENLNDFDNNLSDLLDSLKDHEFLSYFTQCSSPLCLFHSYGTYSLPVDGDEMKVYTTSFCW